MTAPFPWFELLTEDVPAAARLLADRVGGGTSGSEAYAVVQRGGRPLLGVMRSGEAGSAPHWLAFVHTEDVAAWCRRLAFLQGELLEPPTEVEGVGTTALGVDPAGAVLAPTDRAREAGVLGLLAAPRADLASRTYRALLDWKEDARVATLVGPLLVLKARTRRVAVVWQTEAVDVQWLPCLTTDATGLDAVAARGTLLGPVDLPKLGTVAVERTALGFPLGWCLEA